jgi:hypothetical protein
MKTKETSLCSAGCSGSKDNLQLNLCCFLKCPILKCILIGLV